MTDSHVPEADEKMKGPHLTPNDDLTIKLVNTDREEGDEDD